MMALYGEEIVVPKAVYGREKKMYLGVKVQAKDHVVKKSFDRGSDPADRFFLMRRSEVVQEEVQ